MAMEFCYDNQNGSSFLSFQKDLSQLLLPLWFFNRSWIHLEQRKVPIMTMHIRYVGLPRVSQATIFHPCCYLRAFTRYLHSSWKNQTKHFCSAYLIEWNIHVSLFTTSISLPTQELLPGIWIELGHGCLQTVPMQLCYATWTMFYIVSQDTIFRTH